MMENAYFMQQPVVQTPANVWNVLRTPRHSAIQHPAGARAPYGDSGSHFSTFSMHFFPQINAESGEPYLSQTAIDMVDQNIAPLETRPSPCKLQLNSLLFPISPRSPLVYNPRTRNAKRQTRSQKKERFTLGSWNVRTLLNPETQIKLDSELSRVNVPICALQETRCRVL